MSELSITCGEPRLISKQGIREPDLLQLQSGDLLLTYHVQADSHFAERLGMRSTDGGVTWEPEPRRSHREQVGGQGPGGLVLLPDIYTFEVEPGKYLGSYFKSTDGGATFSGPHETVVHMNSVCTKRYPTPDHFPPEDHVLRKFYQPLPEYYHETVAKASWFQGPTFWRNLVKVQGRWLTAMQTHFHGDNFYRTVLVASEDEGANWHFVTTIADFRDGEPGDGFCEPALMPVADGSLLCIMRRGGRLALAQTRSTDGGESWGAVELLPGHGVDPDLCLMSNGVLACTYGRPGLHIMFSPDGCGYSWGYRTQIGDWRSSTYMSIAEVEPEKLLLVFDQAGDAPGAGRDPEQTHIGAMNLDVRRAR